MGFDKRITLYSNLCVMVAIMKCLHHMCFEIHVRDKINHNVIAQICNST